MSMIFNWGSVCFIRKKSDNYYELLKLTQANRPQILLLKMLKIFCISYVKSGVFYCINLTFATKFNQRKIINI